MSSKNITEKINAYSINCDEKTTIDETVVKVERVVECPKCGQKYLLHTLKYQMNYCFACGASMGNEMEQKKGESK